MKCEFCYTEWKESNSHPKTCSHCGAKMPESEWQKSEPFFYAGYIVWSVKSAYSMSMDFVFYKGAEFVGNVNWSFRRLAAYQWKNPMPDVLKELQFQIVESNVPFIEDRFDQVYFQVSKSRLLKLDRQGIALEVDRIIEEACKQ